MNDGVRRAPRAPRWPLAILHGGRHRGTSTGYSSLSHPRRLPVDEIKIDKSFVVDMAAREDDSLIVRSIIDLGHHRGLEVVAEGVETPQIRDLLADLGCDMAQGYGVSRPLPAADFTGWLQDSHWRPAPS